MINYTDNTTTMTHFDDGEKIQSIEAKLIRISDDILVFEYKNEELEISFNKIKKAKVKISF